MAIIEIKNQDEFTKLTTVDAGSNIISLYFYTSWAEPCKAMSEVYSAVSEQSKSNDIVFLSIDADEQSEIAELFEVTAVPYFIIVKEGIILNEISGADPKEFVDLISSFQQSDHSAPSNNADDESSDDEDNDETEEELAERLTNLTQAAPVMLFMKGNPSEPKCGFSRQLVGLLRENQVRFGFFDILKDDSVRQGLKEFADWPTFPQLYVNGEFQGGLDIIKESLEEDPEFFQNALSSA